MFLTLILFEFYNDIPKLLETTNCMHGAIKSHKIMYYAESGGLWVIHISFINWLYSRTSLRRTSSGPASTVRLREVSPSYGDLR